MGCHRTTVSDFVVAPSNGASSGSTIHHFRDRTGREQVSLTELASLDVASPPSSVPAKGTMRWCNYKQGPPRKPRRGRAGIMVRRKMKLLKLFKDH